MPFQFAWESLSFCRSRMLNISCSTRKERNWDCESELQILCFYKQGLCFQVYCNNIFFSSACKLVMFQTGNQHYILGAATDAWWIAEQVPFPFLIYLVGCSTRHFEFWIWNCHAKCTFICYKLVWNNTT